MNLDELYEKLRKVEALVAEGATAGERNAATNVREALRDRIAAVADEPPSEWRFAIHDPWKRRLFYAICRKHGVEPYRYTRQKRQSVMVRAPRRVVQQTLIPEFDQMSAVLFDYLDSVTPGVVEEVLGQSDQDASVVAGELE